MDTRQKQNQGRAQGARRRRKSQNTSIEQIGESSSQIVLTAAKLLDEEVAAGIITAKKVQDRFAHEKRIDPSDFATTLQRFQADGHEVVNTLNAQVEKMRSGEGAELASRLIDHTHGLLDLAIGLINTGAEIANEFAGSRTANGKARGRKQSSK